MVRWLPREKVLASQLAGTSKTTFDGRAGMPELLRHLANDETLEIAKHDDVAVRLGKRLRRGPRQASAPEKARDGFHPAIGLTASDEPSRWALARMRRDG